MVDIHVKEERVDERAHQVECHVTVENNDDKRLDLLSLDLRHPEGVDLQEVKDRSSKEHKGRYETLCRHLTRILQEHRIEQRHRLRERWVKMRLQEKPSYLRPIYLPWLRTFASRRFSKVPQRIEKQEAYQIEIKSLERAKELYKDYFESADKRGDSELRRLYQIKLEELKHIGDTVADKIVTMEPASVFTRIFVLDCERTKLYPVRYNLTVECAIRAEGQNDEFRRTRHIAISITPMTYVLTAIAIIFAILGVMLEASTNVRPESDLYSFWGETLPDKVFGANGLAAVISAIIFFNIYELTEFGRRAKPNVDLERAGISWRSALVIGTLCGLLNAKILAVLQGTVGGVG